jgi:hypothetical protein
MPQEEFILKRQPVAGALRKAATAAPLQDLYCVQIGEPLQPLRDAGILCQTGVPTEATVADCDSVGL